MKYFLFFALCSQAFFQPHFRDPFHFTDFQRPYRRHLRQMGREETRGAQTNSYEDYRRKQEEARQRAQADAERRAQAEAEQKAQIEAENKAKFEAEKKAQLEAKKRAREERLQEAKLRVCENWEKSVNSYLESLPPLKLKPEVHRRNHHFDMYTIFIPLPSDISKSNLDIVVKGPKLTVEAKRPIALPKHLMGYDFCESDFDIPQAQIWQREWDFESPIESEQVQAGIISQKLKLEFPNPPEHETFHIAIKEIV